MQELEYKWFILEVILEKIIWRIGNVTEIELVNKFASLNKLLLGEPRLNFFGGLGVSVEHASELLYSK